MRWFVLNCRAVKTLINNGLCVCNGTTFDHGQDELVIYPGHLSSLALVRPSPGCRPNGHFNDWLDSRKLTVIVDHIAADGDAKMEFDENEMVSSYSSAIIMQACSKQAYHWWELPCASVAEVAFWESFAKLFRICSVSFS